MKNSPELERLASVVHTTTAVGYGLILFGHVLGVPYNRIRRNRFESAFHVVGLTWCAFAIGVDILAGVAHARSARETT
jgi:hypothetical protein